MTTWEIPDGYGRVKPDIVAYGVGVPGSRIYGGCRVLSGTSVASPVVAGVLALLSSVVPEKERARKVNPASIKQAIVGTGVRLKEGNIFEQGFGRVNLRGAYEWLRGYEVMASVIPGELDLTDWYGVEGGGEGGRGNSGYRAYVYG